MSSEPITIRHAHVVLEDDHGVTYTFDFTEDVEADFNLNAETYDATTSTFRVTRATGVVLGHVRISGRVDAKREAKP